MRTVCRVRISRISAGGRIMIVVAVKKSAARSAAGVSSGAKPIPHVVADVHIRALAVIKLIVAWDRSLAGVVEIDDLPLCDARGPDDEQQFQQCGTFHRS